MLLRFPPPQPLISTFLSAFHYVPKSNSLPYFLSPVITQQIPACLPPSLLQTVFCKCLLTHARTCTQTTRTDSFILSIYIRKRPFPHHSPSRAAEWGKGGHQQGTSKHPQQNRSCPLVEYLGNKCVWAKQRLFEFPSLISICGLNECDLISGITVEMLICFVFFDVCGHFTVYPARAE